MVTGNISVLRRIGNDVLGTGGELLFIVMLAVSSLALLTGYRCFSPSLRRWYGIMFAVTIILGTVIDATGSAFAGGAVGQLTGHTFLLTGLLMTVLTIPLLLTANRRAQKQLGKYWKKFQQYGVYAIWVILLIHLALLEGFGVQQGDSPFHQRLYQLAACSILLLVLRLPNVRSWIIAQRKSGSAWVPWAAFSTLMAVFALGFVFMLNELFFKGIGGFSS